MSNMMWSFVMFFMGIQVLRAKYESDDAKETTQRVEEELENLKSSLHPENSAWYTDVVKQAELTPAQQKILSASLGSMLMYGEALREPTLETETQNEGVVEGKKSDGTGTSQGKSNKKQVRMI